MTERFPDLEIYLLKPDSSAIEQWLKTCFPQLQTLQQGERCHWRADTDQGQMDIFLNPQAEKNFASLWFKQNRTPWANDLDCARQAHAALQIEVRCSAAGWQEGEQEDDSGWIKLIRGEEKPLVWR
ncbi:hypothetical protein CHH28_06340 [Bacterioplanes sanyensis]|uniref:Uncharacterized protein n=1 Tax=Bacterioplanes sanyensis TaxID=1249553 RepID=A0A222FIS6_9GAMM|nr:hypothetical protein [Bacterioplanes sanyensis]ASP38321.1 hypothetical protein CHH28_06340 [Bacterioplanes sanyensis]